MNTKHIESKPSLPENFMPKVNGKVFRCECGCNVFSKPDPENDPLLYECNSCEAWYRGEPLDS